MNREKDFDNILDRCLQRVLEGESVEACLKDYPEQAAELEPLLKTAAGTRDAVDIKPRPEFRDRAAREFQEAIRQMPAGKKWWQGFVLWKTGWVTALSIIVVLLAAGGGTVAAAQGSLPDNPLYSIKLATEDARLWLTRSEIGKAQLYAEYADRRVQEVIAMVEKGKVAEAEKATGRMDEQLLAVANLIGPAEEQADITLMAPSAQSAPTAGSGSKSITSSDAMAESTTTATMTATTTTRATMTTTASATTPAPVAPTPTVTVTVSPSTTVTVTVPVPAARTGLGISNGHENAITQEEEENNRLRDKLAAQNSKNAQEIVDLLATAPDSTRDVLEHALNVINNGYSNAINNIDLSNQKLREEGGQ